MSLSSTDDTINTVLTGLLPVLIVGIEWYKFRNNSEKSQLMVVFIFLIFIGIISYIWFLLIQNNEENLDEEEINENEKLNTKIDDKGRINKNEEKKTEKEN
ncbi:hypothetical protein C1645_820859 [Glomus cerebriforme]|uniref:Uncharacterized protein n=1 Tax=Glomus cerebriforme TaxID=658196 RepID=A0A397TBH8_9GLOM|nr:hypothetical protein C1645_820859 [Glomus cerebriforme]